MNAPWTRAAEGLPRRAFTVSEVERMVEVGLIQEDERIELVGGEIVPMSPKGNRHETLKRALLRHWYETGLGDLDLLPETTFRLSENTYLEPDVLVFPRKLRVEEIAPTNVLLAVEISDSSLGYDLGVKARIYGRFGVRELWVIDAKDLVTHVHVGPGADGYMSVREVPEGIALIPLFAPKLSLRLSDLGLENL
jgi:Uma2 family endonuclease